MQSPQLDTNSNTKTTNHCSISLEPFIGFHAHVENFTWAVKKKSKIPTKNINPLIRIKAMPANIYWKIHHTKLI